MAEFSPQDMPPQGYESDRRRQLEAAQWFSFIVQRLAVYDLTDEYDLDTGEHLYGAAYKFDTSGELIATHKTSNTGVYAEESHLVIANPWQLYQGSDHQMRRARLVKACSYQVDSPETFSEENLQKLEGLIRSDATIPQLSPDEEKAIEDAFLAYMGTQRLRHLESGDSPQSLVRIDPRVDIEVKLRQGPNYRSEHLATTSSPLARKLNVALRDSLLPTVDEGSKGCGYAEVIDLAQKIINGHIPPELPPATYETI